MKLTPQGNRLIAEILPLIPDSPIVIPDAAQTKDEGKFIVREVGPGKTLSDGTVVPIPLKVGDEIIVDPKQGYINGLHPEWLYEGKKFCVIEYEAVICKVDRSPEELAAAKAAMLAPKIAGPKPSVN